MRISTGLVLAAVGAAAAAFALSVRNSRTMPRLEPLPAVPDSSDVSVLLPARNESANLRRNLAAVADQTGVREVLVLDDDSADDTGAVACSILSAHTNATVLTNTATPPPGWLGKAWACQQLFEASTSDIVVFVDADVQLHPGAITAAVNALKELGVQALSPYPRQECPTVLARLVQPLLQWSWMSTIPWRYSLDHQPASMAVANGQFLVLDASAYRQLGGHAAVRDQVVDDVELARALRRQGFRTAVVDGSRLATCRMYATNSELVAGYTKSLWCAFGVPPGSWLVIGGLAGIYLLPPIAMIRGRGWTRVLGAAAFGISVANRVVVARTTGQRQWPDALTMPLSIAALSALYGWSELSRRRGTLQWKGRALP